MIKKSQYRLKVYEYIQAIIGRTLTPKEHRELKEIMVEYVQVEAGYVKGMEESLQKQGQKIKELRQTMMGKLRSFIDTQGIDEKKLEILKALIQELK